MHNHFEMLSTKYKDLPSVNLLLFFNLFYLFIFLFFYTFLLFLYFMCHFISSLSRLFLLSLVDDE